MKNILFLLFLIPTIVLAQLELPYSVKVLNPRPLDAFYFNSSGTPYTNTAQVISQIIAAVRYRGLTVNVNGTEYWFAAGTADGDLVAKENTGITNSGTANEVVKSDGTNIVGTGVFTSSAGLWTRTGNFNLTTTGDATFFTANGVGVKSTNVNNAVVYNTFSVTHETTGTPGTGIGTSIDFIAETSANNNEIGASIQAVTTDVTAGSEDFDLRFRTMAAGAPASRVWINDIGLGIGATPPSTRELYATSSGQDMNAMFNAPTGFNPRVQLTINNETTSGSRWDLMTLNTNNNFQLTDGTAIPLRVTHTGNVGIGVDPTAVFHVETANEETAKLVSTSGNSGGVTGSSKIILYPQTTTNQGAEIQAIEEGVATNATGLNFKTRATNTDVAPTTKLSISGAGILNIATAPTNDNTETSVLVRQSDGEVQTRTASSLAASPAGSNGEIQYNNSGSFGASANLTFLSDVLSVNGKSLIGPSVYSFTSEIVQLSKVHSSYASIEDALTIHVAGSNSASISDGFGGQMKIGLSSTTGTIGRTGIFSHSWVNVGSNLSKVRYGQVVGANLQSGVDFFSDGTTTFINGNGNSVLGLSATGIKPDNYGVKHARASTGSIAAASSTNVNVAWSTSFPDTNYTVIVSVFSSTTDALIAYPTTKSVGSVDISVHNSSGGSVSGEVQVIAIHD